jgi:hypothetical protein
MAKRSEMKFVVDNRKSPTVAASTKPIPAAVTPWYSPGQATSANGTDDQTPESDPKSTSRAKIIGRAPEARKSSKRPVILIAT